MLVGRILGCIFLVVAAVALFRDAVNVLDTGRIALLSSDQLWEAFGPTSLYSTQTWGETSLPVLWDPVITTILWLPLFLVAGVLGVFFLLLSRKPRPRKRRRRSRTVGGEPA